jgi:hypothetical protein
MDDLEGLGSWRSRVALEVLDEELPQETLPGPSMSGPSCTILEVEQAIDRLMFEAVCWSPVRVYGWTYKALACTLEGAFCPEKAPHFVGHVPDAMINEALVRLTARGRIRANHQKEYEPVLGNDEDVYLILRERVQQEKPPYGQAWTVGSAHAAMTIWRWGGISDPVTHGSVEQALYRLTNEGVLRKTAQPANGYELAEGEPCASSQRS